jgi:hypothetical protein
MPATPWSAAACLTLRSTRPLRREVGERLILFLLCRRQRCQSTELASPAVIGPETASTARPGELARDLSNACLEDRRYRLTNASSRRSQQQDRKAYLTDASDGVASIIQVIAAPADMPVTRLTAFKLNACIPMTTLHDVSARREVRRADGLHPSPKLSQC